MYWQNLEQNLQQKLTESSVDANVGLDQLSKRLDGQARSNEVTASVLESLTQKIDELSANFSSVQADMQRWKTMEVEYNAENMEEDATNMGNATASVPMSVNPSHFHPLLHFWRNIRNPASSAHSISDHASISDIPSFIR